MHVTVADVVKRRVADLGASDSHSHSSHFVSEDASVLYVCPASDEGRERPNKRVTRTDCVYNVDIVHGRENFEHDIVNLLALVAIS